MIRHDLRFHAQDVLAGLAEGRRHGRLPGGVNWRLGVADFHAAAAEIPAETFFRNYQYKSAEISPDGNSIVIATGRADWDQQIFRSDLWLYHDGGNDGAAMGTLIQLTQSGHDSVSDLGHVPVIAAKNGLARHLAHRAVRIVRQHEQVLGAAEAPLAN